MNNEIIDKNLKLIYESPRDYTEYFNFIDIKINPQKRILAEEMDVKGLIKLRGEFCYKTDFGKEVMDKGGWIEYLNIKKKEEENKIKQDNERQKLKDQIDQLTRDNLRLNNWDIRFRWLIAFITFLIGFVIKHFIDK